MALGIFGLFRPYVLYIYKRLYSGSTILESKRGMDGRAQLPLAFMYMCQIWSVDIDACCALSASL